ncbi:indole-3-glycerol phosphate synthase TrpC [Arachidicoccus terrestris]|uniref:indole-3-glycerol phosphate synthase TrpC n=1 Tax=Arachidicoccus terrestris TaxID=2875539 RepID=UPI001CC438F2|nr:indole-3-glycerol phosphate synthase TrpC [Arachidicoccus terrestris]UAY54837.1 indole-3-glycerol phosphate synthase TrpC [Arachidicoccus terrestris]
MKNILEKIIDYKIGEVARAMKEMPASVLMKSPQLLRRPYSLKERIQKATVPAVIAEYKRRSPSKGVINDQVSVEEVTGAYTKAGASSLSILTDQHFFGGSLDDLKIARDNDVPILRKDFIIEEYQLLEARAAGADVILLIAACLSAARVKQLAAYAKKLELEVLLEIHTEEELDRLTDDIDLVGINNRNLKTFEVDIRHSIKLRSLLPKDRPAIAESGISDVKVTNELYQAGFKGFLIGEYFMKNADPGTAFSHYISELNALQTGN